jgi:NADH-quinone oxidoreductase subunit J
MDAFVFYAAAVLMVIAALLVVTRRNPIYSAIWLVLFFTQIALCFLTLRSPFIAVVQILVYGGAIMVLFLFVLMLLNLTPEEMAEKVSRNRKILSGLASFSLFICMVLTIRLSPTVSSTAPVDLTAPLPADAPETLTKAGEVHQIGKTLFQEHVLAFELTSILIFIAIIGAIYLTKTRRAGLGVKTADSPATMKPELEKEAG